MQRKPTDQHVDIGLPGTSSSPTWPRIHQEQGTRGMLGCMLKRSASITMILPGSTRNECDVSPYDFVAVMLQSALQTLVATGT